jgi:hypothetical protein
MKKFKEFLDTIDEATITEPGKNPIGAELVVGGSSSSEKFSEKLRSEHGIDTKKGDKIQIVGDQDEYLEVNLGGKEVVFIKLQSNFIKIIASANIMNGIFNYERGRGKGGVAFEGELADDLMLYYSEGDLDSCKHTNTMKEIDKFFKTRYGIDISSLGYNEFKIIPMGKQNQKRTFQFTGNSFVSSNNTGKTLTDITLEIKGKTFYLSLKKSKSYYSANVSMRPYLEKDSKTRSAFYKFFGIDPEQMVAFGTEYTEVENNFTINKNPDKNIAHVIEESMGSDYILVYQLNSDKTYVKEIISPKVKLKGKLQYFYPDGKKCGHLNIKSACTVDGLKYVANLQFRSTKSGVRKPQYLRLLMEKK